MTETIGNEIVVTYLKQLHLTRIARCANGSKPRPSPTRNGWRTLTFL